MTVKKEPQIWSLKVFSTKWSVTKPNEPVQYYVYDGPQRGLVREELLVVPPNTELPRTALKLSASNSISSSSVDFGQFGVLMYP